MAGSHRSSATATGLVDGSVSRATRASVRTVRSLTNVFAWLGAAALAGNLVFAGDGIVRFPLAAVVVLVVGTWLWWPRHDGWAVAVAEGVVTAGAVVVLPNAQPVLAFLFGTTTRRALHGGPGRYPVRSLVSLGGYVGGLCVSLSRLDRVDPGVVMAGVMPLLGLVIGTFALHETVRAVRAQQPPAGRWGRCCRRVRSGWPSSTSGELRCCTTSVPGRCSAGTTTSRRARCCARTASASSSAARGARGARSRWSRATGWCCPCTPVRSNRTPGLITWWSPPWT
nr:hypothetical protein [Lentzea pudingi]